MGFRQWCSLYGRGVPRGFARELRLFGILGHIRTQFGDPFFGGDFPTGYRMHFSRIVDLGFEVGERVKGNGNRKDYRQYQ